MISLNNITIHAGAFVLRDISMEIESGAYGVLMGRTGCGKTTLLEVITGLKTAQGGTIHVGGVDVTKKRPAERGIGYVPQDGALFKTMTIRENLSFALDVRKWPAEQITRRVGELAEWLGISDLLERYPFGLSGGERQRVALGRALAFNPGILLLDEPLSAVDQETRGEMYDLLRRVKQTTNATVLHVTHNSDEARELSDFVFVLRDGRIRRESDDSN